VTGSFTIAPVIDVAQARKDAEPTQREVVFDIQGLTVNYGRLTAISGVDLQIYRNLITAIIGPSGCGKSTFIRCLNRMNDLVPGARIDGQILYQGADLYASDVDPVEVRRRIGMVFQKANPFPKSIYDNVGWGPRVLGMRADLDERVEKALRSAAPVSYTQLRAHETGAYRVCPLELVHQILDCRRRNRVERRRRLVQQEHFGLDGDSASDAEPLLLAAR
jgi:ABC-type multidrug transport system fused ATPase/permease subunit